MISQNKIKVINSLAKKKFREQHQMFIAEGEKLTLDLIDSQIKIKEIFFSIDWDHSDRIPPEVKVTETTDQYLKKISQLKTAPKVIALCEIPDYNENDSKILNSLVLALDEIQDPGNLGTIIRLADWFGIKNIVCSHHTVDAYNPKVVQATMGAIARVKIHYKNLAEFISLSKEKNIPAYGTFLDGENIYQSEITNKGIVVMGNEGNGISSEIERLIDHKLLIPSFTTNPETSESLNVSTATAITLSEFKRRSL